MASDRAFRILAQSQPDLVEAFVRLVAPDLLPPEVSITPESVGDPHLDALAAEIKADWLAHAGPRCVVHLECQGYTDIDFPERLIRYHLAGSLRYWDKRLHTIALWLIKPPAKQAMELLVHGDIQVKVTSIVLPTIPASTLLRDPRTACFAAGADPGSWTVEELCARVVEALERGHAGQNQWSFALVAARMQGRYKEMVKIMQQVGTGAVVMEDYVQMLEDLGPEEAEKLENLIEQCVQRGNLRKRAQEVIQRSLEGRVVEARDALLDTLEARGLRLLAAERKRIGAEESIDRLRTWRKQAVTAGSVAEVLAMEPARYS